MGDTGVLAQTVLLTVLHQVIEAEQAAAQGVAQDAVVVFETQSKFGSNFLIFSVTSSSRLDGADGVAHHARITVHRTRRPVALADFVEHGPADADAGV